MLRQVHFLPSVAPKFFIWVAPFYMHW
jgi:hypothetical protein